MKNDEVHKFSALAPLPFCSAAWATTRARPWQNRSKAVASKPCGPEPLKFQSLNKFRALRAIAPVFPVPPVQSLLSALAASLKEHGRSFNGPPSALDRDRKSRRTIYGPLPPKKALGFSLKVAGAIRSRPERARGPREAEFESKNVGFYSKRRLRAIFRQRRRTLKNLCKRL